MRWNQAAGWQTAPADHGRNGPIQSANQTGFNQAAVGKADQVHYQKIRPSQGASRTVTIPAIIITMLDTTPSALPI